MINMINLQTFLMGLLLSSTFTGLATEALKTILTEHNKQYHANTLAGLVALVITSAIGIGYTVAMGISFTAQSVIAILALVFMSWLCAMVGYDKVIQTISQIKTTGKDDIDE